MFSLYRFTTALTFLVWFVGVFFLNIGKEIHLFFAIGIYATLNAIVSKKSWNRKQLGSKTAPNADFSDANLAQSLAREFNGSVFHICMEEEDSEDGAKELNSFPGIETAKVAEPSSFDLENEEKPIAKTERKALVRKLLRNVFRNRIAHILDTKQELERLITDIRQTNGNREKRLLPLLWLYSRLNLHHPYVMNWQRAKWYKRNAKMRMVLSANIRSAYSYHSQSKRRNLELGFSPGA
jgi:hypothetical protein